MISVIFFFLFPHQVCLCVCVCVCSLICNIIYTTTMKYSKKASVSAWCQKNWLEPADGLKKKKKKFWQPWESERASKLMVKKKKREKKSPTGRYAMRVHSTKHHVWTNPRLPELYWLISEYKPK